MPVAAAPTARQEGDPEVRYDGDVPLVGVDRPANVVMVGAPLIDESYEAAEGFDRDTSGFGNLPFLTNLMDRINDCDSGPVFIDGGHGQFEVSYALSAEDAAYYLRYLEGVGIGFEGANRPAEGFGAELLDEARAIVVTTPAETFDDGELAALESFAADGGGVVLMGAAAPADARANLDAISAVLCSDLRLNTGRVVDSESALIGDPSVRSRRTSTSGSACSGRTPARRSSRGLEADRAAQMSESEERRGRRPRKRRK